MRITPALLIVLGCSGGKHPQNPHQPKDPHEAELDAAAQRRKELEAERPKRPYETRERLAFRPGDRCGQGPYRIQTESLRAKYGEQIVVYACGLHPISGNYRLTVERKGQKSESSDRAFGFGDRENSACKAKPVLVTSGTGSGSGSASPSKPGGTGGAAAAAPPPTTLKPTALARVADVAEGCAQVRTGVLDSTYTSSGAWVPLDAHLVLDLWSDEPLDLEGLLFVIEKNAVVADMTVERWAAFQKAENDWYDRYRAFIEGEVTAGRSHFLDTTAKTPPPPPPRAEIQPPRPSKNARWIAGYWQYDNASFHWLSGLWQVPDEDIAKDLTVHAPSPPPAPPPAERPQEPAPTAAAVWTPGQWQWDGRAYVWIAGAWRIPPSQQHTWQPATWSVRSGGAVFVPGGWHVSVKLRR